MKGRFEDPNPHVSPPALRKALRCGIGVVATTLLSKISLSVGVLSENSSVVRELEFCDGESVKLGGAVVLKVGSTRCRSGSMGRRGRSGTILGAECLQGVQRSLAATVSATDALLASGGAA